MADDQSEIVRQLRQQLEEQTQRAVQATQRADQATQRADQATQRADQEYRRRLEAERQLKLHMMTAHSYASCLSIFLTDATLILSMENFGIKSPTNDEMEAIKEAWKVFRQTPMNGQCTDELKQAHPYVKSCLDAILESRVLHKQLRLHPEAVFQLPSYKIDFVWTSSSIERPTYATLKTVIEVKAPRIKKKIGGKAVIAENPTYEGRGQAISYLATATLQKSMDAKVSGNDETLYSIFTNGESINFFRFDKNDPNIRQYSPELSLSDILNVDPDENPSEGFVWLFSLALQLARNARVDYLILKDLRFVVTAVIQRLYVQIFIVAPDNEKYDKNERFIVKKITDFDKYSVFLDLERTAYHFLRSSGVGMNLLTIHEELCEPNTLVLSPVGQTFVEVGLKTFTGDGNDVHESEFEGIVIKALRELEKMHQAGYCHVDIRPQNIIVVKANTDFDVYLIDFSSTTIIDTYPRLPVGLSIFSSTAFIQCDQKSCYKFNAFDDLESFCYSVLFAVFGVTNEVLHWETVNIVQKRNKYIEAKQKDVNWQCPGIVSKVVRMLELLETWKEGAHNISYNLLFDCLAGRK